jgi:hypothetical protein
MAHVTFNIGDFLLKFTIQSNFNFYSPNLGKPVTIGCALANPFRSYSSKRSFYCFDVVLKIFKPYGLHGSWMPGTS